MTESLHIGLEVRSEMPGKRTLYCCVYGRVQGVFYRAFTHRQAKRLNLTGWVRNRDDGSVELIASGDANKLDAFVNLLRQGPPSANVQNISQQEIEFQEFSDFEVR